MAGHQLGEEGQVSIHFDEYGFKIIEEQDSTDDSLRCHVYSPQPSSAVSESWKSACESWACHNKESPKKLRLLLRKGVPKSLRSEVWKLFVNSSALKAQSTFDYQASLSRLHSKLSAHHLTTHSTRSNVATLNAMIDKVYDENSREEDDTLKTWAKTTRQIMMDIVRTFPYHRLFLKPEAPTKCSLFNILMLYSTEYNTGVGYCQGMSYVVALLLMNMDEEDAFWTAVSLFERKKYLAGYYNPSLSKIKIHAEVFGLLLKDKFPQLASHLEGLGVHPLMYVTSWFMCLFTTLPCWDTVLAICDTLFLEGVNTIFRAALAIMEVCAPELVSMYRIEEVLPFLQHLPSRLVSLKNFSPVFWRTTIHNWEVELYQDAVHNGASTLSTPTGLKRPAQDGDEHEEGRLPSKRLKTVRVDETPSSSGTQSIFNRLVNAITPARLTRTRPSTATLSNTLPPMNNSSVAKDQKTLAKDSQAQTPFKTPSTQLRRKRKLVDERLDLETPSKRVKPDKRETGSKSSAYDTYSPFKTPSTTQHRKRQRDGCGDSSKLSMVVEMKDFSANGSHQNQIEECDSSTSFTGFSGVSSSVTTPGVTGSHSLLINRSTPPTLGGGPLQRRRSARIAKRRSLMEESRSVGSEYSLAPLGTCVKPAKVLLDDIQSTRDHRELHAFKTFSTHKTTKSIMPQMESDSYDSVMKSPEVELRAVKKKGSTRSQIIRNCK